MPRNSYLCEENLPRFQSATKRVFSDYLSRNEPIKGVINNHMLEECFLRAQRQAKYYNMEDGSLSPYKEIALLGYFIKTLGPFRLSHKPSFWEKARAQAGKLDEVLRGRPFTVETLKTEETYNINTYVSYIFCRTAIGAVQQIYIRSCPSDSYRQTLEQLRQHNWNRLHNIERSVISSINEFTGGPIDFASMIETMLMIDEYSTDAGKPKTS